ncbi:hypothetical protein DAETH_39370 (plasmid) [Deinococcus aetherius]|uniref:Transposase n=1 Tax=Deinococcus aetherius TaxID=200252 RepID=A0ABN6RMH6_9DEIO|nr:hypothetical protein [Deinococcus aetherius]BDP43968.1 hypothetical protein DAETH_39370 [Deinococcus aetherius]
MEDDHGASLPLRDGRVYVLRVWHEAESSTPLRQWRATLREGTHGEKRHFASIDDCIEHLYGELVRR